ncbi:hypothetical protein DFH07DRAFT_982612 [Mycena maculata]|uniref:Uncharacterized protein n=1 Tax=Mycena maculata TaxID=230809 RepID=A0AAD7N0N9_9AGAR|nr:hypothetical protein DFH07DRAFT_982612 [Mycena maculata]
MPWKLASEPAWLWRLPGRKMLEGILIIAIKVLPAFRVRIVASINHDSIFTKKRCALCRKRGRHGQFHTLLSRCLKGPCGALLTLGRTKNHEPHSRRARAVLDRDIRLSQMIRGVQGHIKGAQSFRRWWEAAGGDLHPPAPGGRAARRGVEAGQKGGRGGPGRGGRSRSKESWGVSRQRQGGRREVGGGGGRPAPAGAGRCGGGWQLDGGLMRRRWPKGLGLDGPAPVAVMDLMGRIGTHPNRELPSFLFFQVTLSTFTAGCYRRVYIGVTGDLKVAGI